MSRYPLMLATPAGRDPVTTIAALQRSGEWTFEFKFDGIRALVIVEDGCVKILNRNDRDITYRYPDVVAKLAGIDFDLVLDGEIVCLGPNGLPDFSRVHHRDAQGTAKAAAVLAGKKPATLVAFDLLHYRGVDTRLLPYSERRRYLTDRTRELAAAGVVLPPASPDGATMWAAVEGAGMEGLVAKRTASKYAGRRSSAWVKIKSKQRISALVSGYEPGEGHRAATFGALTLAVLDDAGTAVHVGTVGSGFSDAAIRLIWKRLQAGDHPIIVDVEFLEFSHGQRLRQPVFKSVRTDLEAAACALSQLIP